MAQHRAARPPGQTRKWRGEGFQMLSKGSGTRGEAPEVTRFAPGRKNAILHPALYSPPLFPITSQRKARIGFRPPFQGYKYHPLHAPLPLPPTWPGPSSRSATAVSARPRLWDPAGEGPARPPHETEPHSWLRSGVLSHGGGRLCVGRRDAHAAGGKEDAGSSNLIPLPPSGAKHVFGPSQGRGGVRLAAEGSQAGLPRPREPGAGPRDSPRED